MFGRSFKLFDVLGFRVGAHWSFPAALVVAGLTRGGVEGIALSLLLFVSVLLHELGHAVVARRRGVPIAGIDLHFFGGVAKMSAPPKSPDDEIAIAIAGPLVSLALAALFFALTAIVPSGLVGWLAGANLVLGVFNLVPALPMDGGRVLRAILAKRRGLVRGTLTAVAVSRVFAVLLGVLGVLTNPWLVLMAVLVWTMGTAEARAVEQHWVLTRMGARPMHEVPWARYDLSASPPRAR